MAEGAGMVEELGGIEDKGVAGREEEGADIRGGGGKEKKILEKRKIWIKMVELFANYLSN